MGESMNSLAILTPLFDRCLPSGFGYQRGQRAAQAGRNQGQKAMADDQKRIYIGRQGLTDRRDHQKAISHGKSEIELTTVRKAGSAILPDGKDEGRQFSVRSGRESTFGLREWPARS
jgi:hypothetical protein